MGGGSAGQSIVSLSMNNQGSRTWSRVTGANIGERIAIGKADNKVHMAPSIREKIQAVELKLKDLRILMKLKI